MDCTAEEPEVVVEEPLVCIKIQKNVHDHSSGEFGPRLPPRDGGPKIRANFFPNDYFPADCGSVSNGPPNRGKSPMDRYLLSELGQVQRKYLKVEENGRQILANGSTMSRNRGQLLELLKKAKENVQLDLNNAGSPGNVRRNLDTHQKILCLMDEYETVLESVGMASKDLVETSRNLDKIIRKLQEQKLKIKKLFGPSPSPARAQKRLLSIENRLYQMVSQFDTVMHKNKAERAEIRTMMKDRGDFYRKCQFTKGKINFLKDQMNELAKNAAFDYDQRDDLRKTMHRLKVVHEKDSKNFTREMKDVTRVLDNEDKVQKFMNTKDRERPSGENEKISKRTLQRLEFLHRTIRNYKLSFVKILELANSRDENALIREYRSREQINFKQFKKISELDCETLKVYETILKKVKAVEGLHAERRLRRTFWKENLAQLFADVLIQDSEVRCLAEKLAQCEKDELNFLEELDEIFKLAECDDSGILRLLGKYEGVTSRTADLCLSILEKKLGHLLHRKKALQLRVEYEIEQKAPTKTAAKIVRFGNHRLSFESKSTGGPHFPNIILNSFMIDEDEYYEGGSSDLSEKVYSYEELKSLVSKMLQNNQTLETIHKNNN